MTKKNQEANQLIDVLAPYKSISIIGMAKNVGKTTTLGYLIKEYNKLGSRLALTSIGRDGEEIDVATQTKKPKIFVHKGTIIVTGEKLLNFCDITKEIISLNEIYTPFGRVASVRALSSGYVQLGGPSITTQISDLFVGFDVDKIIVDGAVGRKTLANPTVTDATILCTGASLNRNMNTVIEETRHTARMLTLPKLDDSEIMSEIAALPPSDEKFIKLQNDNIYVQGYISDAMLKGINKRDICIIADDPSKIFASIDTYQKLQIRQIRLLVKSSINLAAITINPVSAYGNHFDAGEFLARMRDAVNLSVYDVGIEI